MWVMYGTSGNSLRRTGALRFMDIRNVHLQVPPKMGVKAKMIAVATASGTGSEVTRLRL